MERADKIFMALGFAAIIAALVWPRAVVPGDKDVPNERINTSETPANNWSDIGPVYLLSNLPANRLVNNDLKPVTCGGC